MKTILFYWSKGSETRRKIIRLIAACERKREACYLNLLAERLGVSHVAVRKHLDLLVEEKYVEILNPEGKPNFLTLTPKGAEILKELSS
jgi:DNA-binding transcriptional ArsR family regulator